MHVQTLLNWTVIKVFDSIFPPLIANPKYYFENRYHFTLHHTSGLSFNWGSPYSLFPLYNISLLFSFLVSQSYTGPSQFNPLDLILSCLIFLYFMLIYLDMHLRTALDYFYSLYQTLFLFTPVDLSWYVLENCTWSLSQLSLQTLDLVLFCFIPFHLFWSLLIHTWGWFDFSCKYVCRHWQALDPFLFHFDFISLFWSLLICTWWLLLIFLLNILVNT